MQIITFLFLSFKYMGRIRIVYNEARTDENV